MLTEFLLLQKPRITLKSRLGDGMNIYQTKIIRVHVLLFISGEEYLCFDYIQIIMFNSR